MVRASRSRLSRPTPCSAENEPPMRATTPCTTFVHRVPSRQIRALVRPDRLGHVEMDVAVAEMAEGHHPGARREGLDRPRRLVDEGGHGADRDRDVVLDRPALANLRLGDRLAQRQNSWRWSSEAAIAASSTIPRSNAVSSAPAKASSSPCGLCDDASMRTYQACAPASGARASPLRTVMSCAMRPISSKLVTPPPSRSRASPSRSSARSGLARPMKAVARARGLGNSLSDAAVTTPSVPSEPMKRLLHVVAGVVLAQLAQAHGPPARRRAPLRPR